MKRYFLDTNILMDLIANRQPFSKYAELVFRREEQGLFKLYTSSHAIATLFYLLKREIEVKELKEILLALCTRLNIIAIDSRCIIYALNSPMKDTEVAMQYAAAATIDGLDGIITRNLKDFKGLGIPAYSPDELFVSEI
jgi:predicted nucleic acid-binding protein